MATLSKGHSFGAFPYEEIARPLYEAMHLARGKKVKAKLQETIDAVQALQSKELHRLCTNVTETRYVGIPQP